MPETFTYDAFISYRHKDPDQLIAARLHRALETYRVPTPLVRQGAQPRIARVFRDREELPTSSDLSADIDNALRQSRYLIVICSPRTPASAWVAKEVRTFQELGRSAQILAVLIEGEPAEAFPRPLQSPAVLADVRAADLRASLRRLGAEKLRLAAPVLGCDHSALVHQHRDRWVRRVSAAALGLVLAVAALTGYSLVQWSRTAEARQEALLQQDAATAASRKAAAERDRAAGAATEAGRQAAIAKQQQQVAGTQRTLAEQGEAEARKQESLAEAQRLEAETQRAVAQVQRDAALRNESHFLSDTAFRQSDSGAGTLSALLALAALPTQAGRPRPYVPEAESALSQAVYQFRERMVLRGHTDRLVTAAWSADGRRVLTSAIDETVRIWDAATGREITRLAAVSASGGQDAISPDGRLAAIDTRDSTVTLSEVDGGREIARFTSTHLAPVKFSPDSRYLVMSGDEMSWVRLYDTQTGTERILKGHTGAIANAAFSPDSRRLMTAGYDETVRMWDTGTGALITVFPTNHVKYSGMDFFPTAELSADGKLVALTSHGGILTLYGAESGAELATLQGPGELKCVAFSPDGRRVAATFKTEATEIWDPQFTLHPEAVVIWEIATGRRTATLSGHTGEIHSVAFSGDGAQVLTASADGTARLWDGSTGRLLWTLGAHRNDVIVASFRPDGRAILTASGDGTAMIWERQPSATTLLAGHAGGVRDLAFSPDSTRLVTASADKSARIWDVSGGSLVKTLMGHSDIVSAVAYSPDGTRIATASLDATVRIWDANTGDALLVLRGHETGLRSLAYSPDGAELVTGAGDGEVRLWDARTGQPLFVLAGHTRDVVWVGFSPDGRRVLTASYDGTARLWDAGTGQLLQVFAGHTKDINAAAFSPDGSRVATVSDDKTVRVWDTATGQVIHVLTGHTEIVEDVAFSPDGALIASTAADQTARLWDAASGTPVAVLAGHSSWVALPTFAPDGRRLLTASGDGTVRIWDVATGSEVAVLRGHGAGVWALAISPDGRVVATGSKDQDARLWRYFPTTEALVAFAAGDLSRSLTDAERAQFFFE